MLLDCRALDLVVARVNKLIDILFNHGALRTWDRQHHKTLGSNLFIVHTHQNVSAQICLSSWQFAHSKTNNLMICNCDLWNCFFPFVFTKITALRPVIVTLGYTSDIDTVPKRTSNQFHINLVVNFIPVVFAEVIKQNLKIKPIRKQS